MAEPSSSTPNRFKRLRKGQSSSTTHVGESSTPRSRGPRPSHHVPKNWAQFQNRRIHPEKGIDLEKFRGRFVAEQVAALHWEQFVTSHHSYCSQLVREFYANMQPDTFHDNGIVTVRGRPVVITAEAINSFYGLIAPDPAQLHNGMPQHVWNTPARVVALANALRTYERDSWVTTYKADDLSIWFLNMEPAFWSLFVLNSIRPSLNWTNIKPETAFTVFCILSHWPINVGYIIFREMQRPAREKKLSLFFPLLITQMCIRAGIVINEEELESKPAMIGVRQFNSFARERGLDFAHQVVQ